MAADQGLHLRVARKPLPQSGVEEVGRVRLSAQLVEIEDGEDEIADDAAGAGVVGYESLAPGLVGRPGDDLRVVEAAPEPVDQGLVDLHVQVVLRYGAVLGQDPGEDPEIGLGCHRSEADRDAGSLGGVGHGDRLQVADLALGGELEREKVEPPFDVGGQERDPEVAELVFVVDEPVDDGLRILGGDDGGVVRADLFPGNHFDLNGLLEGGCIRGPEDNGSEVAVLLLLEVELEEGLGGGLQLGEDLVVAHGQLGHRRQRQDPGEVRGGAAVEELDVGGDGALSLNEEDVLRHLVHREGGAEEAAAGANRRSPEQQAEERRIQ